MCQVLPCHLLHCWSPHRTATLTSDGGWGVGWEPKSEDVRWCVATGCGHGSVERGGYSVSSPLHETALEILSLTQQSCCGAQIKSLNWNMVLSILLHSLGCMAVDRYVNICENSVTPVTLVYTVSSIGHPSFSHHTEVLSFCCCLWVWFKL